ncbi:MAG: hypothetical protein WD942_04740 [Dehalococcoidia bacterium]
MSIDRQLILTGRQARPAVRIPFEAGEVSARWENDHVSEIRHRGVLVVLRVYAAVRDQRWATVGPESSRVMPRGDGMVYEARHRGPDFDVRCSTELVVSDGRLRLTFTADAEVPSLFNRIGFNVLLPPDAYRTRRLRAGGDRDEFEGSWPDLIAPQRIEGGTVQGLFPDVKWIETDLAGSSVRLELRGETLEFEDQRNWTDASFKGYARPLWKPRPLRLDAGDTISQELLIDVRGRGIEASDLEDASVVARRRVPVTVRLARAKAVPRPRIGTWAREATNLDREAAEKVNRLGLDHVRIDVDGSGDDGLVRLSSTIEAPVELALTAPVPDAEVEQIVRYLIENGQSVARVLWIPHDREVGARADVDGLERLLAGLAVPLFTGTDASFVNINRHRTEIGERVAFGISPQIHQFDDRTLFESLPEQETVIETLRSFSPVDQIAVGPVTLRPPPWAGAGPASPDVLGFPKDVDVRQASLLLAAWTAASYGHLAHAGASSVTYFEAVGPRGLVRGLEVLPSPFPSWPESVFPAYRVVEAIATAPAGAWSQAIEADQPGVVGGFLLRWQRQLRAVVANLCEEDRTVLLDLGDTREAKLFRLGAETAVDACRIPLDSVNQHQARMNFESGPIELGPYDVVIIDAQG